MTDLPILFSAPMVRALLAGTKTQTRRALKPQPHQWQAMVIDILPPSQDEDGNWGQVETVWSGPLIPGMCEPDHEEWHPIRHHRVGDRLWVRERIERANGEAVGYPADGTWLPNTWWEWKKASLPSIYMPRRLSRITLTVTDVRVQRLQEISEEDARAEGIVLVGTYPMADSIASDPLVGYSGEEAWSHDPKDPLPIYELPGSAKSAYRRLWNQINGARAWEANPWVAAYTFTVALGNIDKLGEVAA